MFEITSELCEMNQEIVTTFNHITNKCPKNQEFSKNIKSHNIFYIKKYDNLN